MSYTLYSYWRSTAAWRVRLALQLKGLAYQIQSVHLIQDGGQQHKPDFRQRNPQGLVPCLQDGDWHLSQSQAICQYLEAQHPQPALLFLTAREQAEVLAFCAAIACDTHPLNNLRVLQYLEGRLKLDACARTDWYRHWVAQSFAALEQQLQQRDAAFAFGDHAGLAECFLIPQIYNARRFDCPLDSYPRLTAIDALCAELPAFKAAHPDNQPDKPDHA